MAIYLDVDSPAEKRTWSGSKNYKFEFNAQRTWQVRTTDVTDGPELVLSWMQTNKNLYIGVQWPDNGFMYCTDIDWIATEPDGTGARMWEITYKYGSFPIDLTEPNPLLRPYTIDWDTEVAEEAIERDYSAAMITACKEIATTAGTPFDPPVVRPVTYSVLRIVRNEQINTYDETAIQDYRWTVNQSDWQVWIPTSGTVSPSYITIPARCALCTSVKPTRVFSQTLQTINNDATLGYYLEVEYVFNLKFLSWGSHPEDPSFVENPDDIGQGWDKRILNKGFNYLDSSGNLQRAKDQNGNPTADPVFLDKDGHLSTVPTYRTFQIYAPADYGFWNFVPPTP